MTGGRLQFLAIDKSSQVQLKSRYIMAFPDLGRLLVVLLSTYTVLLSLPFLVLRCSSFVFLILVSSRRTTFFTLPLASSLLLLFRDIITLRPYSKSMTLVLTRSISVVADPNSSLTPRSESFVSSLRTALVLTYPLT